jgi:hypothetical protein
VGAMSCCAGAKKSSAIGAEPVKYIIIVASEDALFLDSMILYKKSKIIKEENQLQKKSKKIKILIRNS